MLARKVYSGGKQFSTVSELRAEIEAQWAAISADYIVSLVGSMPQRCISVIQAKGDKINY